MDLFTIVNIAFEISIFNILMAITLWASIFYDIEDHWIFKIMWIPPLAIIIPVILLLLLLMNFLHEIGKAYALAVIKNILKKSLNEQ